MSPGTERQALLPRVRDLFLLLVGLVHVVQVLEWLDAGAPLWPQLTVAAVCLAGSLGWAVLLHRRGRGHLLLDVVLFVAIVGAGWGLGRPNAVIALLVGVAQLRALYDERRPAVGATAGILGAYGVLTYLLTGLDGVLDLGLAVVVVGLAALAMVIRLVGEAMGRHDLAARWDAVLTEAAEELVGATELREVDAGVERALHRLEGVAPDAGGGLWSDPVPTGAVPRSSSELAAVAHDPRTEAGAPRLARVLRRLDGDLTLARERVASEQRFRALAEASQDAIYVLEMWPTLVWRYLNPAAEALLGISSAEAAREPDAVFARVHPEDRSLLSRAGGRDGMLVEPVRFRVVRESDQQVTWVEARETVLECDEGRPRVVQGMARDVTRQWSEQIALRRALQQQEAAARDLRALDEMKSMFLRAVSHELRTPLTAVLGSAVTLQRRAELDDRQVGSLLDAIHRQATRLERLLEDLLDVDRLSRGIVAPEREPTDLVALVHRVVEASDGDTHPVTVAGGEVLVAVDPAKVERIVDNLLRNAGKHTPHGTPIRIEVTGDVAGAVLTVEDEGPGVPAQLRQRIFEPFAQGVTDREVASPGTGIGLALVSKLAELHGGRAWIEEPEGGGARFVVTLPAQAPAPAPEAGTEPPGGGQLAAAAPDGAR